MDEFCKKHVWSHGFSSQCSRKAKRDGYCKQHHPDAVKARREKSEARWEEERVQRRAKWDAERLKARKAAAFDALLEAVDEVRDEAVNSDAPNWVWRWLDRAIESAKKAVEGRDAEA